VSGVDWFPLTTVAGSCGRSNIPEGSLKWGQYRDKRRNRELTGSIEVLLHTSGVLRLHDDYEVSAVTLIDERNLAQRVKMPATSYTRRNVKNVVCMYVCVV
jgi:hypothetical protein